MEELNLFSWSHGSLIERCRTTGNPLNITRLQRVQGMAFTGGWEKALTTPVRCMEFHRRWMWTATFVSMFLALILGIASSAVAFPVSLDLPERQGVREALERIGARAGVEPARSSWPWTAREARDLLRRALERDSNSITASDSVILRDLVEGPRELWRWENGRGGSMLALNARAGCAGRSADAPDSANVFQGTLGGRMYGNLAGEIWYASDARIFTEWADAYRYQDRYVQGDGEPSGVPFEDPSEGGRYKSRTGARFVAWAQWSRDWLSLKYGRDRVRFGPGAWTGLTTRLETPPYNLFDARIEPFPWLSVQSTVLEARVGELEFAIPGDARKWCHVHRFEVRPARGVALAFQNQVLYRDSGGVNPSYLLPLVPIFFSQDLAGNRDNAAFQFDATLNRFRGVSLWGVLMLDDLNSASDILGSSWLNRWAVLAGGRILSPWKSFDADLTTEWSMVRPWTYTGGREEAYTFAHYGLPMGSELGPDSRTVRTRLAWRCLPTLEVDMTAFVLEKGVGEQATLGFVNQGSRFGTTAELFGDGWVGRSGATAGLRWTVFRDASLSVSGTWASQEDGEGRASDALILGYGSEVDW